MTKYFYRIGLALVCISFLICVYNFYALFYLSFFFLLGIILIWVSDTTLKQKVIATVTPILLYTPVTILFLWIYNYSPTKTILLPEHHVGIFRIFYDESCGGEYEVFNKKKNIRINEDGIAILKESFDGQLNFDYHFIGEEDRKIPYVVDIADTSKYEIAVILGSSGIHSVSTSIGANNDQNDSYRYSNFYLYRRGYNTNWSDEQMDSLSDSSIKNCRKNYTN